MLLCLVCCPSVLLIVKDFRKNERWNRIRGVTADNNSEPKLGNLLIYGPQERTIPDKIKLDLLHLTTTVVFPISSLIHPGISF